MKKISCVLVGTFALAVIFSAHYASPKATYAQDEGVDITPIPGLVVTPGPVIEDEPFDAVTIWDNLNSLPNVDSPTADALLSTESTTATFTNGDRFGVQMLGPSNATIMSSRYKSTGTNFVHMGIEWRDLAGNTVYKAPSSYNWAAFDTAINTANANGLKIIVTLGGNPSWAAEFDRGPINCPGRSNADFIAYVNAVVNRYKAKVKHWAIYNEPDASSFRLSTPRCQGDLIGEAYGDNPAKYKQLLQESYNAIKAADSSATVLLGGLAYDAFNSEGGFFERNFLANILNAGAGPYFDVMNFHYYPTFDWRWAALAGAKNGLNGKTTEIRNILGTNKPIAITEIGLSSSAVFGSSADTQSRAVVKQFTRLAASDVKIGIWYTSTDYGIPSASGDPFVAHGLFDSKLTPKRAFAAYFFMAYLLKNDSYTNSIATTFQSGNNIEGYRFTDATTGAQTIVLWTTNSSTQSITMPSGFTAAYDKYGTRLASSPTVSVSDSPIYLLPNAIPLNYRRYLPLIRR